MSSVSYDQLSSRGWMVIPEVYPAADCARLRELVEGIWRKVGSPVPYDPGDVALDGEGISLSSAGFVCRELLTHAPEVAELLDRPALLDIIDGVLGPGSLIEGIAGNLNDESRPFCYWHNHVGGIHAGFFRELGQYPEPEGPIRRLVCVLYLDGLSEQNGEMLVWPRKRSDRGAPPHEDFGAQTWDGQDVAHCPDGSIVLLDEYSWHAVRRQHKTGIRRYLGLYAVAPGGVTTSFAVPALPVSADRSERFQRKLAGASGFDSPLATPATAQELAPGISLRKVTLREDSLLLDVEVGSHAATVEVQRFVPERRAFRRVADLLITYRGKTAAGPPCAEAVASALERLDLGFDALVARVAVPDGAAPAPEGAPATPAARATLAAPAFPTPFHRHHLERSFEIPEKVRDAFRRDGHLLVRGALDRGVVLAARTVIAKALAAATPEPPVAERRDAYARSFTQITNLGLDDAAVRVFTHARRLAAMAAHLLIVPGVRIFCEDWLIKEPGAGITPWHQDSAVMPFDAETITAWIPFQTVAEGDGVLRFARGSHRAGVQPIENISDTSEQDFAAIIAAGGFAVDVNPTLLVGDVSFHHGSTIHGAFPNDGAAPRFALAIHYFADGAVLKDPTTPAMASLRRAYAPDLATGALAASRFWPRPYHEDHPPPRPRITGGAPTPRPLHLRATPVPGGAAPIDVWIHEGRLWFEPLPNAEDVAPEGGFLTSGLVDSHAHLSWPHSPEMETRTRAFMNGNRESYAGAGVTLVRDMGSASDHVSMLADEPGLPRVHAAGMLLVPYGGFPFTVTEPDALARAFLDRLAQGASWIKVFTDWSSDWGGADRTGFSATNPVTYPLPVLRAAVEAAHRAGGRVAAHCFTREGAEVAIRAGVNSLEHGWGVDDALAAEMAARGVAWVPLVGIAGAMWRVGVRDQQPDRAAWIEDRMAALAVTLPRAVEKGVRVLAGTDWFPELTVVDEIRTLTAFGIAPATAVAAGMWDARRWLGEPGLEPGAPADLVLYRADPRLDPDTLDAPALILIGGQRVAAATGRVRRRHLSWSDRARAEQE